MGHPILARSLIDPQRFVSPIAAGGSLKPGHFIPDLRLSLR